jgi:toxin-antitoxin system PIN domain toxin
LDVSVLIALVDPTHSESEVAHAWFARERRRPWATCPITQNGVLRIMSQPRYPNSPGAPSVVAALLKTSLASPDHEFWPDDISLLDGEAIDVEQLVTHKRVTDSYLLALAVRNGGCFATLDRRLSSDAVVGGKEALLLL